MAAVSPALPNIDTLVGPRKRLRGFDSDHRADSAKRSKIELEATFSSGLRLLGYIPKKSRISNDVISRLRNEITTELLLKRKKLHLVLDLDHTLLNTTYFEKMSPEEEYLKRNDHSLQYVYVVETRSAQLVTKLRPFIRTFLEGASKMFELSIYTNGSRDYALEMAKLLDPGGLLFGGRVISSHCDSTVANKKNLDVVLARGSAIVILDDKKHVWREEDQDNVIVMPRYHFFRSSCDKFGLSDVKSYSELKTDEYDWFGGPHLAKALSLLRIVHDKFFNGKELQGCQLVDRDVSYVLELLIVMVSVPRGTGSRLRESQLITLALSCHLCRIGCKGCESVANLQSTPAAAVDILPKVCAYFHKQIP